MIANQPVLIIEGAGDKAAIPNLLREMSKYKCFPAPNPILKQSIPGLSSPGKLERYARYAMMREDGDSVLFLLDTDEKCAKEIAEQWRPRLVALNPRKKIGIGFFVREFEAYFLACLDLIAAEYANLNWDLTDWDVSDPHETPRGANEKVSGYMGRATIYKETQHQAGFVSRLDFQRLHDNCRSYRHLESLIDWLIGDNEEFVYPIIP